MIQMFKYDCQVQHLNVSKDIKQIYNVKFPCYLKHLHELSYILYTLFYLILYQVSYVSVCC